VFSCEGQKDDGNYERYDANPRVHNRFLVFDLGNFVFESLGSVREAIKTFFAGGIV